MSELFDISLILKKTPETKKKILNLLSDKFGLYPTKSKVEFFGNRELVTSVFDVNDYPDQEFEEICIGVPNQVFHQTSFEQEIETFTIFINTCFKYCEELQFAVCSYAINWNLLSGVKTLKDFNDELLHTFPLAYKRTPGKQHPTMMLNLEAQAILEFAHTLDVTIRYNNAQEETVPIPITTVYEMEQNKKYFIEAIDQKHLNTMSPTFYRHVLVCNAIEKPAIRQFITEFSCLDTLMGNIYETFEHKELAWQRDAPEGQMLPTHLLSYTWCFAKVTDISTTEALFDERIALTISWLENCATRTFHGSLFVVSTAQIEKYLTKRNPYYRRHILIMKNFDRNVLQRCLQNMIDYLDLLHPSKRLDYLQNHLEYIGKIMSTLK